ncbi:hypothetical protein IC617_08380 [Neiella sp. HB171785]|uniref:Uncharacterized protein n=1 Tax=Neiella litorisoli TaxID=2771431 RepID=A0A8J6QJS7_9GAMM|nr:hypothetical protein [Neiella litorisoli]MBD1389441.1 hypothetical protein [Neiella litorisoli]
MKTMEQLGDTKPLELWREGQNAYLQWLSVEDCPHHCPKQKQIWIGGYACQAEQDKARQYLH